jgi:hypothetical protein
MLALQRAVKSKAEWCGGGLMWFFFFSFDYIHVPSSKSALLDRKEGTLN